MCSVLWNVIKSAGRLIGLKHAESVLVPLAVVTGATGGIGSEVCRALSEAGFAILAQFHSNREAVLDMEKNFGSEGKMFHYVQADLGKDEGVQAVISRAISLLEEHPVYSMRVLVNSAAKLLSPSFSETTPRDFDEYFSINTKAPFFLSQGLISIMQPGGSVVNVSSASAHFSSPGDITYSMSKAALESLTKNMAEAVALQGVRVNAVVPGFTRNGHPLFESSAALDYMSTFSVMGGVADPETVASAVTFLVSDGAKRTTGALLDVTGGSILGARGSRKHSVRDLL